MANDHLAIFSSPATLSELVEFHRTDSGSDEIPNVSEFQNFQFFALERWMERVYIVDVVIIAFFHGTMLYFVSEFVVECLDGIYV